MLHILHLEDSSEDAVLIEQAILNDGIEAQLTLAQNRAEFMAALERGGFNLVLTDSTMPGFSGLEALKLVRQKHPAVPVICVSGIVTPKQATEALQEGAHALVLKDHSWQLVAAIRVEQENQRLTRINQGRARLIAAVEELSLARDLESIMTIVRRAARELTGADGATFVLKDGEFCYYADENAIAPLWKGQRFPLKICISGWAMLNRQPAVIEDIYADPRIPVDAYRPTFVKSLAMVPIRTEEPIGAIGNYWAKQRMPSKEEIELLQALANTTSVAMENVQVYKELEQRVRDRTTQLEAANRELEAFSYAVSHDLRAPLRSMRGFTDIVLKQSSDKLDENSRGLLGRAAAAGEHMSQLIEGLLGLSKFSQGDFKKEKIDLTALAKEILSSLSIQEPERKVDVKIADGLQTEGDAGLLRAAVENLLSNAWKYSSKNPEARIEFGSTSQPDGSSAYYVRDNGAGFDMQYAQRLFQPFQRMHSPKDFPGTGVGLATVQRIMQRHGGRIWAESEAGKGSTFYFTLPDALK